MTREQLIKRLKALNDQERRGKNYLASHGDMMHYRLLTPFSHGYSGSQLLEQDFFPEGKDLEIDKILRYIYIPEHSHDFVEFIYVVEGSCEHTINAQHFIQECGDFVVVSPGAKHIVNVPEAGLCLAIKIKRSAFFDLHLPNVAIFTTPLLFPCREDPFVLHTVLSIYEQQYANASYCTEMMTYLFSSLILYLLQNFFDDVRYLQIGSGGDPRLIQIANYVFDNFSTVTMKSLAKEFHYNESYLSALISEKTGQTFTSLIRTIRLSRAEEILRTTPTIKLADVCERVGYNDTVRFIKDFKEKYGVTPAKYKREKASS